MKEAVARFVPDGASVCMGTALEALIPFAAGHEMIRQRRRGLTLIGPISDILFDQLVGAGCVARIRAAWVGNVSAGLGYNYRRAVEHGVPHRIEVEDHSNLSMATAQNFAGTSVTYIEGTVTNSGDRKVTGARALVTFKNSLGEITQKEPLPVTVLIPNSPYVNYGTLDRAPLAPGQSREFRLTIEYITPDWDGQIPQVTITSVSK